MITNYKLLALDLDGTVLTSNHTISDENRKWIHAAVEAGVTVIFSTGREIESARMYLKDLGLCSPVVTLNGSEVWENPNKLIIRHVIAADANQPLLDVLDQSDLWYCAAAVEGGYEKEQWPANAADLQWLKFFLRSFDLDYLHRMRTTLEQLGTLEISNSSPYNLELNAKGVNKASGIREVCRLLNISMDEVIAVGDSLNDISMIREAGLGIAMGNAQDPVKAIADTITATNNEDGVAKVIQQYIFGHKEE